jgi:acetyl-CoA synthetase (ADP-forming)
VYLSGPLGYSAAREERVSLTSHPPTEVSAGAGDPLHAALIPGPRAPARVDVDRLLHPRSVAVFGASDSKDKFGGRIMHFLLRHGFAGEIVPINPRREEVLGRRAYPAIAAVPSPPDVAILAVPGASLVSTVREAAAAGVGACVIISTGFAEAGAEGAARQAELAAIARESGTRIVGPNCMGLIVPHHRLALCSSVVLDTDHLPEGEIGLVSQSGALMVSIVDRASADGIGFRYGVSLGNQVDLEICDFIDYMVAEPHTHAICVYVEGLLDGVRFRRSLAAAREAGKPVLIVKTGRTQAGVKSARSHTASLAGAWEVFAAVCRAEGAVLARDPDDMVRAAHFLVRHRAPRQGGVAILSSSGGGCGIVSDRVSELGVPLATLTADSRERLGELLLPPQADNPVDLGGRRVPEDVEIAGDVLRILLQDPNVAYGFVMLTSMPFFASRTRLMGEVARQFIGKPVLIALTPGAAADGPRRALRELGQFYFDRTEDALRVLALLADHDALRTAPTARPERAEGWPRLHAPMREMLLALNGPLHGEAKQLAAEYAVAVSRERLVAPSPETAAKAAADLGYPVALKAVSPRLVHKTDAGAVRLGLGSAAEVEQAARDMLAALAATGLDTDLVGLLLQPMVSGGAEVIVGARRDPQFGAVVMVGLGGIAVEILGDVAVAPAPVSAEQARAMIDRLRSAPLLKGARGRPPLAIDAVARAVESVSWLAADLGPRLVDFEINPLIVDEQRACAVDVRATLHPKEEESRP